VFLVVDGAFLGANLVKIPQGGWFTVLVAIAIFTVMTTWKRGSRLVFLREQDLEMRLDRFLERMATNPPGRAPGTAAFLSANPLGVPSALLANLKYNGVLHEQVLLITATTAEVPRIPEAERTTVEPLGHSIYRITVRYGFMEEPIVPKAVAGISAPDLRFDPQRMPYFVNRTRVIPTDKPGMALWREYLYTVLRHNAVSAADFFSLPPTRVFEIGTSVEV